MLALSAFWPLAFSLAEIALVRVTVGPVAALWIVSLIVPVTVAFGANDPFKLAFVIAHVSNLTAFALNPSVS
jgi:hypothetical protein